MQRTAIIYAGNALITLGDPESAVACFERALRIRPDNPAAHDNISLCLQGYIWAAINGDSLKVPSIDKTIEVEKTKLREKLNECRIWFVVVLGKTRVSIIITRS